MRAADRSRLTKEQQIISLQLDIAMLLSHGANSSQQLIDEMRAMLDDLKRRNIAR